MTESTSSIERAAYEQALIDYAFSGKRQRLGQWLCNVLEIDEYHAPGLWEADGHKAKELFMKYFHLH